MGSRKAGLIEVGRGDFQQERLAFRNQAAILKMRFARFGGYRAKQPVAEGQPLLRVTFFPQGLFQHLGDKAGIESRLLF